MNYRSAQSQNTQLRGAIAPVRGLPQGPHAFAGTPRQAAYNVSGMINGERPPCRYIFLAEQAAVP
jgi:hypothetical protein